MKTYLIGIGAATGFAFVMTTTWYLVFGYDSLVSFPENLISVYSDLIFWRSFLIWSILYSASVAAPLAFLRNKKKKA